MATRIGFYTGKIYDSSIDVKDIKECCQVLNEDEMLNDEEFVKKKREELKLRCYGCNGCEESQKNINDGIYWR